MYENYLTFAQTEALLQTAISLSPTSIKSIGENIGIKPCTLYKWKTSNYHLSPKTADKLLLYFTNHEPETLKNADNALSGNYQEYTITTSFDCIRGNEME